MRLRVQKRATRALLPHLLTPSLSLASCCSLPSLQLFASQSIKYTSSHTALTQLCQPSQAHISLPAAPQARRIMSKHTRSVTHSGTNNASTLTLQLPSQAQRIPRKRRKTSTAGCFWSACGGQASLCSDDKAVVTCPAPAMRSQSNVEAFDSSVFEVSRNNMMLHSQAEPVVKVSQASSRAQLPLTLTPRSPAASACPTHHFTALYSSCSRCTQRTAQQARLIL